MAARGSTSTPRRTAASTTTLQPPGTLNGVVVDGPDVIRLTTKKTRGPEERSVLFSIDGTDYTIPSRPRANLSLKVLDLAQRKGETEATAFMMKAMLGEDGYRALMDYDDLEPEDLQRVLVAATKVVFGTMENPT